MHFGGTEDVYTILYVTEEYTYVVVDVDVEVSRNHGTSPPSPPKSHT